MSWRTGFGSGLDESHLPVVWLQGGTGQLLDFTKWASEIMPLFLFG